MTNQCAESHLAMDLSRIFTWRNVPCGFCTLRFGSMDFVPFRKVELDLDNSMSWNTQPNCLEFFKKATEPLPPWFWDLLFGCLSTSLCMKNALFTESASRLCFVHFPLMKSVHSLRDLFPDGLRPLSYFFSKHFSLRFSSAVLEQERMSASICHVCSHSGGNCWRLLLCTSLLLSFCSIPSASLQGWQVSLCLSPVLLSRFFHFWPQNLGLWSSDPYISSPWSSISGSSILNCVVQSLVELVRLKYAKDSVPQLSILLF